ncbi:MAG: T9SS type A sorting domain-containing protein [Bacteroidota bacterium]
MKFIVKVFCILLVLIYNADLLYAQYNDGSGNLSASAYLSNGEIKSSAGIGVIPTSVCNGPNRFWTVDIQTNQVIEYELTGGVVSVTGNVIPNCPGRSLAVCNNLNGGSINPTLYTSDLTDSWYWDGDSTWLLASGSTPSVVNAGGAGSTLVFQDPNSPTTLYHYNGTAFGSFFNIPKSAGISDVIVDDSSNTWIGTYQNSPITDTLYKISPAGQIIQQFAFNINTLNGYGFMLLNGIFYIGLGPLNAINPNTLLPLTISGNTVVMGSPVAMPTTISSLDLASCTPGTALYVNDIEKSGKFIVYPNPATDYVMMEGDGTSGIYTLYSADGKVVVSPSTIRTTQTKIDISLLKSGIYIAELKTPSTVLRKKLIISN